MDKEKIAVKILLGCFEGNCFDCRYANWNGIKDEELYCDGRYGICS